MSASTTNNGENDYESAAAAAADSASVAAAAAAAQIVAQQFLAQQQEQQDAAMREDDQRDGEEPGDDHDARMQMHMLQSAESNRHGDDAVVTRAVEAALLASANGESDSAVREALEREGLGYGRSLEGEVGDEQHGNQTPQGSSRQYRNHTHLSREDSGGQPGTPVRHVSFQSTATGNLDPALGITPSGKVRSKVSRACDECRRKKVDSAWFKLYDADDITDKM
jgi:hypothetical protein